MKKIIKLFLVSFLFIVSINIVKAGELECTYKLGNGKLIITYKNTKLNYEFSSNHNFEKFDEDNSEIFQKDIIKDDGTLYCPPTLYYNTYQSKENIDENELSYTYIVSFEKKDSYKSCNLINEYIQNNIDAPKEEKDTFCKYGKDMVIFNKSKQTINYEINSVSNKTILVAPSYSGLAKHNYACPINFCIYDIGDGEHIKLNFDGYGTCTKLKEGINSEAADKPFNYDSDNANIGKANSLSCETIKKITDPIWKWILIIGPTIALVLGIVDLLKGMALGDDKFISKVLTDFGKRLGLAALLLMLPIIVKLIYGLVELKDITACF